MSPIARIFALVFVSCGIAPAVAQLPETVERADDTPVTQGKLWEAVPDVYLEDKDGTLILIPDFSFEEFNRLIQISRNLQGPEQPWVTLDRMAIRGTATNRSVELSINMTFTRRATERTADDAWVPIPIRLRGLVLRGPAIFRGEGKHFLTIDEREKGYTVWLQAAGETTHELSLTGVIPIEQTGDLYQMRVEAPAVPESSLSLDIPFPDAQGEIRTDVIESPRPLEANQADGKTTLVAIGIRGDCMLSWHRRAASPTTASPARLDVTGTVRVTIEAPQVVNSEARLRVRSFGGPIETFQVRLPPNMVLQEFKSPTYLVTILDNELDEGQLIEVRMLRPDIREANLRLVTESPLPLMSTDPPASTDRPIFFQPARFDVLGSVRQRGTIDIVIQGDWTPSWVEGEYVYRMDQPSDEDESVAARFHYFHQPCNLKVAVRTKATRINVEPHYRISVAANLVSLDAIFRYRLSGGNAGPLAIDFTGWVVDEILFDDELPVEPIDRSQVEPMEIPLPSTLSRTTDFVLHILAHRPLTPGVTSGTAALEFVMPQPDSTVKRANLVVNPAEIIISPADNVELTPRLRDLQGMVAQATSGPIDVSRMNPDQYYRDRGLVERARYAADLKLLPRTVTVRLNSTAEIGSGPTAIRQVLTYSVANVPTNQLDLVVPASLVDGDIVNLHAIVNGIGRLISVVAAADGETYPDRTFVSIGLGEPMIGDFDVELSFSMPAPRFESERPAVMTIPIARPVDGRGTTITQNALSVIHADDLAVELVDQAWTLAEEQTGRTLSMVSSASIDEMTMSVTRSPRRSSQSTVVSRAWIQTWLLGDLRRDRVAFRVQTSERRVRVHLPAGATNRPLVAINGRQLREPNYSDDLYIDLNGDETGTDCVIELWYTVEGGRSKTGNLVLEAPSIVGAEPSSRRYWQLILPEREHVVWFSPSLTPELGWRWKNFTWDRQSLLSQRDVESWVGASEQLPPPGAANDYLFSTYSPIERLSVMTVSRSMLVLGGSGIVLFGGLIWIYFPVVRHPVLLLIVGVLITGTVLVSPPLAAVVSQAAAFGIGLVVLARSMRWMISRRRIYRPVGVPAQRTTESLTLPAITATEGSSQATTATAPLSVHLPNSDSKS